MPHKQNPIVSEKICGLARLARSYVTPVLEGVALWNERDLTHSSVERVAVADAAALTEHVIGQTAAVMQQLIVRLQDASAVVLSNAALVRLTDAGLSYPEAWSVVKRATDSSSDSDAAQFAAVLQEVATSKGPELDPSWTRGLVHGDPLRLDQIFEAVDKLKRGTRSQLGSG
jgi:adenylosuccinate lyase